MTAGNFAARPTRLGLTRITARVFGDDRGFFYESWSEEACRLLGIEARFVQDNHSVSRKGVIRGLHWQGPPSAQGKLVRCTRGRIRDVVVDIREGSPGFGDWESIDMAAARPGEAEQEMLFVPPGFAHGFLALEDGVEVQYKVTAPWDAKAEGCIAFDDPDIGIRWGTDGPTVVSAKDRGGMSFAAYRERPAFPREGAR